MIASLLVICFVAITGYCLVVLWPRLRWSLQTMRHPDGLRPQFQTDRPRIDRRDQPPAPPARRQGAPTFGRD